MLPRLSRTHGPRLLPSLWQGRSLKVLRHIRLCGALGKREEAGRWREEGGRRRWLAEKMSSFEAQLKTIINFVI